MMRAHLVRATLEAIAFEVRDVLVMMAESGVGVPCGSTAGPRRTTRPCHTQADQPWRPLVERPEIVETDRPRARRSSLGSGSACGTRPTRPARDLGLNTPFQPSGEAEARAAADAAYARWQQASAARSPGPRTEPAQRSSNAFWAASRASTARHGGLGLARASASSSSSSVSSADELELGSGDLALEPRRPPTGAAGCGPAARRLAGVGQGRPGLVHVLQPSPGRAPPARARGRSVAVDDAQIGRPWPGRGGGGRETEGLGERRRHQRRRPSRHPSRTGPR